MSPEERKQSAVELRERFLRLTESVQPDVIFEIGANEATFSRAARIAVPGAKMFAFEASPVNHARFKDVPELHGVEYINMAATDHDGSIEFHLQQTRNGKPVPSTAGSNSILSRIGDVKTVPCTVPCTSVESWVGKHGLTGTMVAWIDVEGATREVLVGMGDVIKSFAAFHIEVELVRYWHGQWLYGDVLKHMVERGFSPIARDHEFAHQHNVIFVRDDLREKLGG